MRRARREVVHPVVIAVLVTVALLHRGCGGTGDLGETPSMPREVEIEGLGGPPKPSALGPESSAQSDRAQMIAPTLTLGSVRETVPQGALSWYSFVSQDAPYQIVSSKPLKCFRDVDLYVLGPVRRPGQSGSLNLAGQSCRWLGKEFGLTDWVAIGQAQAPAGELCHLAVHGFSKAPAGVPCVIEQAVPEPLARGTAGRGTIRRPQEHAWFHFRARAGRYHRVALDSRSGDADLYVYAQNSRGYLACSRTGGRDVADFYSSKAQTVFARVLSYRAPVDFPVRWSLTNGGTASGPPPIETAEKVVLVGWVGVQYNHLNECLARGELPVLEAMIAGGSLVRTDVHSHRTDTTAGWAEILTGYGPDINRCFSNQTFRPIPAGLTVFERAKAHYTSQGKDLKTMVVTGKAWPIGSHEREPYYHAVNAVDAWHGDVERQADKAGPLMLTCLEQYGPSNPFFAFFHFCDPDRSGHIYGENSREYEEAMILCDQGLARLLAKLEELNIADETRVLVCTDHGFDEGATVHNRAPDAWLVSDLPDVVRDGVQHDVAPTLYAVLGIPYETFEPPLAGHALTGS